MHCERERSEREKVFHLHLGSKSPNQMPSGWRRWRVAGASVCFPSAYANPRSEGYVGEGRLRTINLVRRAGQPPHPLYSAATGAHQPENGWTPPIRAREKRTDRVVGLGLPERWRSILTNLPHQNKIG
jgi:hypothetical protein